MLQANNSAPGAAQGIALCPASAHLPAACLRRRRTHGARTGRRSGAWKLPNTGAWLRRRPTRTGGAAARPPGLAPAARGGPPRSARTARRRAPGGQMGARGEEGQGGAREEGIKRREVVGSEGGAEQGQPHVLHGLLPQPSAPCTRVPLRPLASPCVPLRRPLPPLPNAPGAAGAPASPGHRACLHGRASTAPPLLRPARAPAARRAARLAAAPAAAARYTPSSSPPTPHPKSAAWKNRCRCPLCR